MSIHTIRKLFPILSNFQSNLFGLDLPKKEWAHKVVNPQPQTPQGRPFKKPETQLQNIPVGKEFHSSAGSLWHSQESPKADIPLGGV